MAKKFDPLEYNYEMVNECKESKVFNFQKILLKKDAVLTDIIELAFWSQQNIWVIFIQGMNLKPFFKGAPSFEENITISLFVGEIKSDFEYQLIMKRICTNPEILIQLGA